MSETQPERRDSAKRAEKLSWSILGTIISALAFGGWAVRDYVENFATKAEVVIAGTKADFSLDIHMKQLLAQINALERKRNKTADDRQQLQWLREELQRMRDIRRGK